MRLVIPVVFFGLSLWFVLTSQPSDLPIPVRTVVDPAAFATTPVRTVPANPTIISIGSVDQRCSDCHQFVETRIDRQALQQHTEIVLNHGLNDRCLNCHAADDRNKLELHDGSLVGFSDVVLLCAKCHGPTYRDWEDGSHGRTNGYWDADLGPQERLRCSSCHDPHAPAFGTLAPLPGPNTFRMGNPRAHPAPAHGEIVNPLDKWRQGVEPPHRPAPGSGPAPEGGSDG